MVQVIPVEPFDLVIFGGTGDLAMRKLLPALFRRYAGGQVPDASRILGVARTKDSDESYRATVKEAVQRAVKDADPKVLERFLGLVQYFGLDATQDPGWDDFAANLKANGGRIRVFYLSTSPSLFASPRAPTIV